MACLGHDFSACSEKNDTVEDHVIPVTSPTVLGMTSDTRFGFEARYQDHGLS
jgi:hypothetical protein